MSLAFPSSRNPAVFLTQKLLCQLPPAAWLEGSCHMCCWRSAPPKAFRHHSCTFIPLLPHRGISELDSDLGHGLGSRDGLLELNIVDRGQPLTWLVFWGYSSGDQKECGNWVCGHDGVVSIRSSCSRTHCPYGSRLGTFYRWQQGHGGLQRSNLGSDFWRLLRLLK